MNYDKIAEEMNSVRRSNNQPEIPKADLIAMLKQSATDISGKNLSLEEKRALSNFDDDKHVRGMAETPKWIKFAWAIIVLALLYYFFR